MLSPLLYASWTKTKAFANCTTKCTQVQYYKNNNAGTEVLQLVALTPKPFGTEAENIVMECFNLEPRDNTQHDGKLNGKKLEIKCARWHATGGDCNWLHLEEGHDYQYVVFALLDFQDWKCWIMTKPRLFGEMREKSILKKQGEEGWTVNKSKIESYLTPIYSQADIIDFMKKNPVA
jgi:hypothetical protein